MAACDMSLGREKTCATPCSRPLMDEYRLLSYQKRGCLARACCLEWVHERCAARHTKEDFAGATSQLARLCGEVDKTSTESTSSACPGIRPRSRYEITPPQGAQFVASTTALGSPWTPGATTSFLRSSTEVKSFSLSKPCFLFWPESAWSCVRGSRRFS